MKRHWKQIVLAVVSALASTLIAALTRREETPADRVATSDGAGAPAAAPSAKTSAGMRGAAVSFFSDVMAETYRKVRSEQSEKRR
jgi:hypothetical protein